LACYRTEGEEESAEEEEEEDDDDDDDDGARRGGGGRRGIRYCYRKQVNAEDFLIIGGSIRAGRA
jgi:hypothetical protein